jgi:hypothetical protein
MGLALRPQASDHIRKETSSTPVPSPSPASVALTDVACSPGQDGISAIAVALAPRARQGGGQGEGLISLTRRWGWQAL